MRMDSDSENVWAKGFPNSTRPGRPRGGLRLTREPGSRVKKARAGERRTRRGGSSGTGRRPAARRAVAVLGEDRHVAGQRGRVAGDVGDRARRAGRRLLDDGPPGALAGRVQHDEVDRGRRQRRSSTGADVAGAATVGAGHVRLGVGAGPAVALDQRRPAPGRPPRSARNAANSPTPAYRSSTDSPGCGASRASTVSTRTSGAPGCTCQKPSSATSKRRTPRTDVVRLAASAARSGSRRPRRRRGSGACASPAARRAARRSAAGCASAGRPRSPGTGSTVTRRRARRAGDSCSRTTSAFSARCRARATCWKSQPPQRPGPAYGHGGATRSGEGSSTSTASPARTGRPRCPR